MFRWSKEVPSCRKTCQHLSPVPNAKVYPRNCGRFVIFKGISCSYFCNDGFVLLGTRVRTCTSDEIWSGKAPKCIRTCKPLRKIAHGTVRPIDCTSTPQIAFSRCQFACDTDFVMQGNENTTCYENSLWSEKVPECLAQCPTLKVPYNGKLHCNGSKQGATCVLHCLNSCQLHGSRIVTCRSDGVWSEPLGVCLETCSKIKAPDHGFVTPEECSLIESSINSTCTFSCEKSYSISGSISIQCMNTRSWSSTNAKCVHETQFFSCLGGK